jgi:hypothetical protein
MIELAAWWLTFFAVPCGAVYHGGRLWYELLSPKMTETTVRLGWIVTYAGIGWALLWPWAAWLWLIARFPHDLRL